MLKKELGLLDVFSIAAGAMISSGLFVLPGIAFAKAGPAILLAYGLAGLVMIPTVLAKAELATAMPKSGGSYFFIERSLGPLAGTLAGLGAWLSVALKATFALVGIGALGTLLVPDAGEWTVKVIAMSACACFAVLNVLSVKGTGRLQIVLVFGLLAILALYVVAGAPAVEVPRYHPFMPFGLQSVLAVAGLVFISFGGLTKVVDVSEEVRRPQRNLPLGMFLAFGVVMVLYMVVVFVTVGTVDPEHLSGSLVPLTLGGQASMGTAGGVLISLGAFLAFATTANAGILAASRTPMAMSRDGLLPAVFSRTNRRLKTPHIAIILTAAVAMLVIAVLSIENLVKTASTVMILMFILMNVAVIIMRQTGFQSYRPTFRAPLCPWLQIGAITVYGFLIVEMGSVPLLLTGALALLACFWYLGYVRRRIDRESAIVYLVKTITSKPIQRAGLEEELRNISLRRDGGALDRFDRLVEGCAILDIDEPIPAKELFRRVSAALAARLDVEEDRLYELFLEREQQSSTVVQPGLAIPHVIVDGERRFELLLVRCKAGIVFSELHQPVRTVFVLVGSLDERNYHLRALMTIARLVREPEFEERWLQAQGLEQLRDVVLLSSREREQQD